MQTDFGPRVKLHDYSGANAHDLETDANGLVWVAVLPMGYTVWGPAGMGSGFAPQSRRTTQEFQVDDDFGDARSSSAEGHHQLAAKMTNSNQPATWAYLKVEYAAPPTPNKF